MLNVLNGKRTITLERTLYFKQAHRPVTNVRTGLAGSDMVLKIVVRVALKYLKTVDGPAHAWVFITALLLRHLST